MSLIKPSWRRLPESSPHSSVGIRRQKYAGTVMGVISHDVWAYYIGCFSQLEPSGANHSPFAEFIGLDCLIHPHPRLGLRDTEEETPRRHHFTPGLFRWENRGKTSHVPSLSCEFCHFSPPNKESIPKGPKWFPFPSVFSFLVVFLYSAVAWHPSTILPVCHLLLTLMQRSSLSPS